MERAAGDFGFDKYAYCALTGHDRYDAGNNPAPAVAHSFPVSWIDYYFEHNYQCKDPVVLFAPEIARPFLWKSLCETHKLDRAQETLMQEASEAGLKDGVGVPLHGPRGDVCLVTFAAGDGHPEPAEFLTNLAVLSAQFHLAYSEVGRAELDPRSVPVLSQRERECLQWIANGKSAWGVGDVLHISEYTVNYHLQKAFRKLGSNNRVLAVVKAIRYGLITP
jgi:LuxR family quorum-sensing system transcriptional regulator CciR